MAPKDTRAQGEGDGEAWESQRERQTRSLGSRKTRWGAGGVCVCGDAAAALQEGGGPGEAVAMETEPGSGCRGRFASRCAHSTAGGL